MAKAVFERTNSPLYRVYDGETLVMKRCAKCEQHKKSRAFQKDASRKDGLMRRCRECCGVNVNRKPLTKEEKLQKRRKHDRAYRARLLARSIEEARRDSLRFHPSGEKPCRTCQYVLPLTDFYTSLREYDGLSGNCQPCDKARWAKIDIVATVDWWEELGLYACVYCDAPYEDIEHTIPRAQGGTDHIENLVPACQECNRGPGGKFARTPAEWRPEQHAEMRAIIGRLRQMQE